MSAEVPEAASAEEQKVSGSREQAREAPSRPHRGPGPAGGLLPPRAEGRAGPAPWRWMRSGLRRCASAVKAEPSGGGCRR